MIASRPSRSRRSSKARGCSTRRARPAARRACATRSPVNAIGDLPAEMGMMTAVWGMDEHAVYLSPAPLYHSAPLFYCMSTMRLGGTVDRDGAVRSARGARVHREVPRHAQPVGADDVRADAEAARRRARAVRPLVAEGRDPRGGTVLGRGQAQDDRVVGTDHRRVLRRDRGHGRDLHQQHRLARAPRLGRQVHARPDPHPRRRGQRTVPAGEVGTVWFEPPAEPSRVRVPQGRGEDARLVQRHEVGRPSATWAISTPTATSTSPIAARS